jgi:cell shape-determining protein MreC
MTHQFRDKKQILKKKKILKNLIGFGVLIILVSLGFLSWTGKLFHSAGRPIWEAERIINEGLDNSNYLLRSKKSLSIENKKLIEENLNLKISMIDYEDLKNEVNQLKEILGRVPEKRDFILGNILTKPNHSPYDTIIIDIGENMDMKEGDLVYANGNIPIGSISKVYNKTSLVSLYSNPGQKTEGFIDISNASVALTGRGGGNFEMIIPLELIVDKGTLIYLPGSSVEIIAIVDDVISTPSDPFKKVLLSSPVNVQNLKWVQVKK